MESKITKSNMIMIIINSLFVVAVIFGIDSCRSEQRPIQSQAAVQAIPGVGTSVAHTLERASELHGHTIKVFGQMHMELNGKQFLVDLEDKEKKLLMPDPPFTLRNDAWSAIVVYTGKFLDSESPSAPCAITSFERIEPFQELGHTPGFPPAEK